MKKGTKGIKEEDYESRELASDDGEKFGGEHLIKVLREEGITDVLVVCSRWFGGTMLGPARFTHIEESAREALTIHTKMEEVKRLRLELEALDDTIDELRADLNGGKTQAQVGEKEGSGVKVGVKRMYRSETDTGKLEKMLKAKSAAVKYLADKIAAEAGDEEEI